MSILSKLQNPKLGTIELIVIGFSVYLRNLIPILVLFCATQLPAQIILPALTNQHPVLWVLFYILYWLIGIAYWITISIITENFVFGSRTSYRRLLTKIEASLLPVFFSSILFSIQYFLLLLVLIVPGIIYFLKYQYFHLAIILRDRTQETAFDYSCGIVKHHEWKVFYFSFLNGVIPILLPILLFFTIFKFGNTMPLVLSWKISLALSGLISIGFGICSILLFLYLEFQNNIESLTTGMRPSVAAEDFDDRPDSYR